MKFPALPDYTGGPKPLRLMPAPLSEEELGRRPSEVYLRSLVSSKGRRSQRSSLCILSWVLTGQREHVRVPWHRLTWAHATALRTWLCTPTKEGGPGYQARTVNRYLCALRGVLQACFHLRLLTADELERLAGSKALPQLKHGPSLSGRRLSVAELRALFDRCADGSTAGARDAASLALMVGSGLRSAELAGVHVEDLAPASAGGDWLKVRAGKGGPRVAFAGPAVILAVRAWLAVRGLEPGPLIVRLRKGGAIYRPLSGLSEVAVWAMVRSRCLEAGLAKAGPHDLRRTMVTSALEAGADLAVVQRLAGHASVATTTIYDRRGDGALRSAAALIPVPFGGFDGGFDGEA